MVTLMMEPPAAAAGEASPEPDPNGSSDDWLDVAFASGEADALRRAYDRYGSLVFTFCQRRLSGAAAADATQETFVAAWRSRPRFEPGRGSLGGWLMGIARFKVIEQMRREGRAPDPTPDAELGRHARVDRLDVETMADRMLLTDALQQLPDRSRRVVELAFYDDLTHAEIAARCELPLGTVKSDLRRGIARLRHHLVHGGEGST
jgi:RNA polymerase sigma-70 factor (ECF subfamily)